MPIYKLGDYIKYNEQFCTVIDITLNYGIQENLKIEYIIFKRKEKENPPETEIISTGELSLTLIDKDIQPKLIPWLKFTDRYNNTVSYLNKKKGSVFTSLDSKNAEKDIKTYLDVYDVKWYEIEEKKRAVYDMLVSKLKHKLNDSL